MRLRTTESSRRRGRLPSCPFRRSLEESGGSGERQGQSGRDAPKVAPGSTPTSWRRELQTWSAWGARRSQLTGAG
eukprot:4097741-Alexandrium_andersonii.AAC.1